MSNNSWELIKHLEEGGAIVRDNNKYFMENGALCYAHWDTDETKTVNLANMASVLTNPTSFTIEIPKAKYSVNIWTYPERCLWKDGLAEGRGFSAFLLNTDTVSTNKSDEYNTEYKITVEEV